MAWIIILGLIIILAACDQSKRGQSYTLLVICVIFTIVIGLRSNIWNDTPTYWHTFKHFAKPIWDFSESRENHFFEDKGFLLLNSLIKTFTSDRFLFFSIIAGITNYFLYKDLMKYTVYPIAGFIVYLGRFGLGRNFMQIRAALAILMVIYAIRFISDRNWRKYFLWVALASTIHISMVIAIPVYWISKMNLNSKKIMVYTIAAIAVTYLLTPYIKHYTTLLSFQYDIATTYTNERSEYTAGKGLANPMIYYQVILLWVYSLNAGRLQRTTPYYTTIRDGYFYSTMILIIMSSFGTLSGRTSTIFATLEAFMLPNLCYIFTPKSRYWAELGIFIVGLCFFYLNFRSFLASHPSFGNLLIN